MSNLTKTMRQSQCKENAGCSPLSCLCGLLDEAADRIEELEALLNEAADDIAQAAHDEHPYRDEYPDQMRRYNRDMDLPRRIRAALDVAEWVAEFERERDEELRHMRCEQMGRCDG